MESNSEVNCANCSKEAANLLRSQFKELPLPCRGPINVKGKGKMKCHWVDEKDVGISKRSKATEIRANSPTSAAAFSTMELEPLLEMTEGCEDSARNMGTMDEEQPLTTREPPPEAPLPLPENPGPLSNLIEKGQKWLQLNKEILQLDNELLVWQLAAAADQLGSCKSRFPAGNLTDRSAHILHASAQ